MIAKKKLSSVIVGLCVSIVATCQAITHVDVLVAYDTSAAQWISNASLGQQTFAEGQIAKANKVLQNSGLGDVFDFRLVGIHSGAFTYKDMVTTLKEAVASTEQSWTALRSDRDKAGADMVMILVNTGKSSGQMGNSNGMEPYVGPSLERKYGLDFSGAEEWLKWFAESAYGIVDVAAANDGYTFVHEMGHIMGAGHADIISVAPGPQLYDYSRAVMAQGSDNNYYSTVMGYNVTGYSGSPYYTVLPYFSSPNVKNPDTGDALGDATHDNVRTLRNTYAKVAAFRAEASSPSGSSGSAASGGAMAATGEFTAKKTVVTAAVRDRGSVVGIAEFTVAATKKGESRVSCSIIGLDGKKKTMKPVKSKVYDNGDGIARATVSGAVVKGADGLLSATIGSDGSLTGGSLGSLSLLPAVKGIGGSSVAGFYIAAIPAAINGEEVVQSVTYGGGEYSVLPSSAKPEEVQLGVKWTVAKGGKVMLKKNKDTGASELVLKGTGNFSALRLNYQAKTGAFKGSFTAYALGDDKLKKYKFNVTGVAVDGKGIGVAICKNANIALDVFVE